MRKGHSLHAWCRLIRDRRWSFRQKRQLIERFVEPREIFAAPAKELRACISGRIKPQQSLVSDLDVQKDLQWLEHADHHLLTFTDKAYPNALRQIPDAPVALFAIGDVSLLNDPCIAVVGSRQPTPIGARVVEQLVGRLAEVGIVITSGLALGIDGIAHQSAISAAGKTIAVLGSGLDVITPARHRQLFRNVCRSGLVVSEYPLGHSASKYTFPERNRIVSGLCLGVVIVEAARRSGTLITARLAAEQNREVMVVPGSVLSAQYQGSHTLIKQGAALVTSSEDILACLSTELSGVIRNLSANAVQTTRPTNAHGDHGLLKHIGSASTQVDDIILASGLTAAEVSSMLITLEMEGVVAMGVDGGYVNLS